MIEIEEGALFIADAHYPTHGDELLQVLYKLDSGEINTPQLFLMGDIFDFLVGYIEESYLINSEAIRLINSIAKHTDIFYFEGNHDFKLKKIFENIKIYPITQQPQYMDCKGLSVGLAHGDKFKAGAGHFLLNMILRNRIILNTIKILIPDIVRKKNQQLSRKSICKKIDKFDTKAQAIFDRYKNVDWVIEGHYHQGRKYDGYISLPSLACQKQVSVMRDGVLLFVDLEKNELFVKVGK